MREVPFSSYFNLNLLSLANTKYIISRIPLTDGNLTLMLQTADKEGYPSRLLKEKAIGGTAGTLRGRRLFIYRNENFLPRFFVAGGLKAFENSSQLLDSMSRADTATLRTTAFIERKSAKDIDEHKLGFEKANITIKKYSPDTILLRVDVNDPGILIATNSYSPHWKCQVDGAEKKVIPVDDTFYGVYLGGWYDERHPSVRSSLQVVLLGRIQEEDVPGRQPTDSRTSGRNWNQRNLDKSSALAAYQRCI